MRTQAVCTGLVPSCCPSMGGELQWENPIQMGIVPILLTAGRVLLPVAIGAGAVIGGGLFLEDELGIQPADIPAAAILAGASAAGFSLAGVLPESVAPIATIAGIGAGVASLLILFSGREAEAAIETPPATVPKEEEVPPLSFDELRRLVTTSTDTLQEGLGGGARSALQAQSFRFGVRNNTDNTDQEQTLSFFAAMEVSDDINGRELVFATPEGSRVLVTVAPGQSKEIILSMPSLESLTNRVPFFFDDYVARMRLYRARDDKSSFRSGDEFRFTFGPIG